MRNNRHLKIDVYRGPQTSTGHVTRLQPRVYGKFSTFSTARGRFSRKSFTSTFICMNILGSHVCLALMIYRKNLFLSFHMNFNINKTTVLFLQGLNDNCCTTLKSNMSPRVVITRFLIHVGGIPQTANLKLRFAVRGKRRP